MLRTILLIDDDVDLSILLKPVLALNGFNLIHSHNAASGLQKFTCGDFVLVLLDVVLPDMDGMLLCQRLKTISAVPVLMLTSRTSVDDKVVAFGLGADDYLSKPFDSRELLSRIHALLRRLAGTEAPVTVGKLQLFPRQFLAKISNTVIPLTSMEFNALLHLASYPGMVLSKDELSKRVKGYPDLAMSRAMDALICRLRQKLSNQADCAIYTIRGKGYKLVPVLELKGAVNENC